MTCNLTELSKIKKENDGSKKLAECLIDSGKIKMIPWIAGAFVGGVAVTLGVQKIVKCLNQKKVITDEELDIDKEDIIEDIKYYDVEEDITEEVNIDKNDIIEEEVNLDENNINEKEAQQE